MATETSNDRHLVTFRLGGQLYGVDIMQVHRVLVAEAVKEVPGAPPAVSGMVDIHGTLVAVVSLVRLLGIEPPPSGTRRLVVVRRDEAPGLLALAVEEVEGRIRIGSGDLLERPGAIMVEALVAAFHQGEEMGYVLDPDRLKVGRIELDG